MLPRLQERHEVLAPTLAGHAGGPPLDGGEPDVAVLDAAERAMDEAGFETAHLVGNSLGGWVALALAARGRARSVVALAPAGGWAEGDTSYRETLAHFERMQEATRRTAPHAEAILATPEGRRRATADITVRYEHLPAELLAHQLVGVASCAGAAEYIERALRVGWPLDPAHVGCPVRVVWGTEDRLLPWPSAAARWRAAFPQADWVVLDDVGHCPQLDVPLETAELIVGFTA